MNRQTHEGHPVGHRAAIGGRRVQRERLGKECACDDHVLVAEEVESALGGLGGGVYQTCSALESDPTSRDGDLRGDVAQLPRHAAPGDQ